VLSTDLPRTDRVAGRTPTGAARARLGVGLVWLICAGCAAGTGAADDVNAAGASAEPVDMGDASVPPFGGEAGTGAPDAGAPMPPVGEASDEIYGRSVPRSNSFWTEDGRLYQGANELRLRGINWFGLDTQTLALFGPAESNRSVAHFLEQIRSLGFNALRVPLAPESIRPGHPTASWAVRSGLDTGRKNFEALAEAADAAGIYMLWDIHTCAASAGYRAGAPDASACGGYGIDDWLADLETLAGLAERFPAHVVGIDLFNEPHSLAWGQWRALAERGGEVVLRRNPHLLVFVEGVGGEGYAGDNHPFWGENLTHALHDPLQLPASRLVYSPHVYGPSVSMQRYFNDPAFPGNMPGIWDDHFGYLFQAGLPVVVGEFGGRYEGEDRRWQDAFVSYLLERGSHSFFYWCLNPNSGDTGGLLQDDWRTVHTGKHALLQRLMQP
jgi:endoglucanase